MLSKTLTIDKALAVISELEDRPSACEAGLIKWKSYNNQVVIESDNYFYKVYEEFNNGIGPFNSLVRRFLAEEYRSLGINWKLITFERDGKIFDFEQREKLHVLKPEEMAFDDVLISFSDILERLEKDLEFPSIIAQLRQEETFSNLEYLKLARFCVNKHLDYGTYDGQVVLLDDADWIICPLDIKGNTILADKNVSLPIVTSYGNFIFTQALYETIIEGKAEPVVPDFNECTHGWYLYSQKTYKDNSKALLDIKSEEKNFIDSKTLAIENSIKSHLATTKTKDEPAIHNDKEFVMNLSLQQKIETKTLQDLYRLIEEHKKIKVITDFPTDNKARKIWELQIKNLSVCFPEASLVTNVTLDDGFFENYNKGEFNPENFQNRFSCKINYILGDNKSINRDSFRKFLINHARRNPETYIYLLNMNTEDQNPQWRDDIRQVWDSIAGA